jgi:hypothetical protein
MENSFKTVKTCSPKHQFFKDRGKIQTSEFYCAGGKLGEEEQQEQEQKKWKKECVPRVGSENSKRSFVRGDNVWCSGSEMEVVVGVA